jgi:TPR repeat protein
MEKAIILFLKQNEFQYVKIQDRTSLKIIYNLLINNKIEYDNFKDSMIFLYYGIYYKIKKDFQSMKNHYLIAIHLGNSYAMYNLGNHYYSQKDYENMKKYLNLSISYGNTFALVQLGEYCLESRDFENMKRYMMLAAEKGNLNAIMRLINYFECTEIDLRQKEKYLIMAIEKNDINSYRKLLLSYIEMKDYDRFKEFFLKYPHLYNNEIIYEFNNILFNNFDFEIAVESYSYLDERNLHRLNEIMCQLMKMKNHVHSNLSQVMTQIDCTQCHKVSECVFLKCGHPVCYQCYNQKCGICNQN